MEFHEHHYTILHRFQAGPMALWPYISDTNRMDRDAGFPPLRRLPRPVSGGSSETAAGSRRVSARSFGLRAEWEEPPFEWVKFQRYGVDRHYVRGPFISMRILCELAPAGDGGTEVRYQIWIRPRGLAGRLALPVIASLLILPRLRRVFKEYDRRSAPGASSPGHRSPARFAPGGRERLRKGVELLRSGGERPALAAALQRTLEESDGLSLARLRPYALADSWKEPRRDVLSLCLKATRAGILDLRWDLLCPHCRGVVSAFSTLRDLRSEARCESCAVDFRSNFDRLVEISFRPGPALLAVEEQEFSIGGPHATPHIVAQESVEAGSEWDFSLPLEEGRYRLRGNGLIPGAQLLQAKADGRTEVLLRGGKEGWQGGEIVVSLAPSFRIANGAPGTELLSLERVAWNEQAATAAEVTSLQEFRDLFASEALRPGEQISVGSLAVVFTDLRGSTRLYREIGDARAFGWVMEHFDILREAVVREDGALVKTMGDAVLAVFRRPVSAVRALLEAERRLLAPSDGRPAYVLKAAIHHGPCIAVQQNGRLDYFGTVVNVASRMAGLSQGGDLIISSAVRDDWETAELLRSSQSDVRVEPIDANLKGFEEEFHFWRLERIAVPEPSVQSCSPACPLASPPPSPQSAEQPAEQPVDQPVEQPVDQPVEQPA